MTGAMYAFRSSSRCGRIRATPATRGATASPRSRAAPRPGAARAAASSWTGLTVGVEQADRDRVTRPALTARDQRLDARARAASRPSRPQRSRSTDLEDVARGSIRLPACGTGSSRCSRGRCPAIAVRRREVRVVITSSDARPLPLEHRVQADGRAVDEEIDRGGSGRTCAGPRARPRPDWRASTGSCR